MMETASGKVAKCHQKLLWGTKFCFLVAQIQFQENHVESFPELYFY